MFKKEENKIVVAVAIAIVEGQGILIGKKNSKNIFEGENWILFGKEVKEKEHNVRAVYKNFEEQVGIKLAWVDPKIYAIQNTKRFLIFYYVCGVDGEKLQNIELSPEYSEWKCTFDLDLYVEEGFEDLLEVAQEYCKINLT